jgi:hypothetical protein
MNPVAHDGKLLELAPLEDPIFFLKKGGWTASNKSDKPATVAIPRWPQTFRVGHPKAGSYNASRLRPLALLRLMMRLPCLVDILFLNPWVRARLILLG